MPDNSEYISQVQQIQEAIESGDPVEITVRVVQLLCMLFGMTAQCFTGDTLVATEEGLKPFYPFLNFQQRTFRYFLLTNHTIGVKI